MSGCFMPEKAQMAQISLSLQKSLSIFRQNKENEKCQSAAQTGIAQAVFTAGGR